VRQGSAAWITAFLSVLVTSPSSGQVGQSQVVGAPVAADSSTCELHVWPTNKFAVTENLGGANYGLVGAIIDELTGLKHPEDVARQFKNQLSPADQERIIRDLDLAAAYHLTGYRVVIEPADTQPAWTLENLRSKKRILNTNSHCYAEMAIISQQYLKQAIGTRLRTFISYKEFGASTESTRAVLDTTATKAINFPAKTDDGVAASTASLQNAFRENLLKFGRDKLKR